MCFFLRKNAKLPWSYLQSCKILSNLITIKTYQILEGKKFKQEHENRDHVIEFDKINVGQTTFNDIIKHIKIA